MGHCVRLIVPTDKEAELGPIIGRIIGRWDGVTILDGTGWWSPPVGNQDDDTKYPVRDKLSILECSIGLWDLDAREWWCDLAAVVCRTFGQDCIFLSVTQETAMLVGCNGVGRFVKSDGGKPK